MKLSNQDYDLLRNYDFTDSRLCVVQKDGVECLGKVRNRDIWWFTVAIWKGIDPSLKAVSNYFLKRDYILPESSNEYKVVHEVASECLLSEVDGYGKIANLWMRFSVFCREFAYKLTAPSNVEFKGRVDVWLTPLAKKKHLNKILEIKIKIPDMIYLPPIQSLREDEEEIPATLCSIEGKVIIDYALAFRLGSYTY